MKAILLRRAAPGLLGLLGLLAACRTCPMDSCHIRKAHYHNGVKYRARPIWKMQYPAIGERIRLNKGDQDQHKDSDRSKPLK